MIPDQGSNNVKMGCHLQVTWSRVTCEVRLSKVGKSLRGLTGSMNSLSLP
jgi:hypothetical protein